MASDDIKQAWKVPEPTLRRLPWYLAFVKLMKGKGETFISSTQIAKEINVDPSQVAKDLSFVNISGKTRVGYDINALVDVLEDFLGFTSQHKAFLFGVGSLGASLLHDTGLSQYGLEIVAGFDVRGDHRAGGESAGGDRPDYRGRNQGSLEFYPLPYTGAGTYRSPEYFYVCAFSCYV